jgi:ABC-2 type transport system ATP-binding protein
MKLLKRINKKVKPILTSSVGFSYKDQEVLRDVSMSTKPGEIVAVIGKSGCGKSTFLKIISGIISTSHQGKVRVFGKPKFFEKDKIGFTPQELSFIPDLSILDNIKLFGLNSGITEAKAIEQANKLLHLLKLNEGINKLPSQLSGGQKVRLNIILSMLHDPQILIMDEPFTGLDFQNRRLLWHFLETMRKKKKSIILTSHLLTETQEHVNRLVILKDGKVFFSGKLEKLRAKLKVNYIYEIRCKYLSSENLDKIKKYCAYKDIKILDVYEKYLMFGIPTPKEKTYLIKHLEKLNLQFEEISFREPNLDETFLKA